MSANPAVFTTTDLGAGAVSVAIHGDVTNASEQPLLSAHERATDAGASRIVLDFAGMDYMNSGGIGLLVTLLVRAQRRNQSVAAVGLTEHYRQIFELTRLDEAITLHADLESALRD